MLKGNNEVNSCTFEVFWGEIAPCDHLVQIYEHDDEIISGLEKFAESGFKSGDSVIIIATESHLKSLNRKLKKSGYNLHDLQDNNQYIPLNAAETLAKFMHKGWPDEKLFMSLVNELIARARGSNNRKIRAYGEMVAILWSQGYNGATVQLEHLWNKFCQTEAFCLFCAYPKSGFTQDVKNSIDHICSVHTKEIIGYNKSKTHIFYKGSDSKIMT
jgi:hypothetical protein